MHAFGVRNFRLEGYLKVRHYLHFSPVPADLLKCYPSGSFF